MRRFESEVCFDYQNLMQSVSLRVSDDVKGLLLLQSLQGHAHNRHGKFSMAYPNATIDDLVLALRKDPVEIRKERQRIIDSIVGFVSSIIADKDYPGYVDLVGKPLLSLTFDLKLTDPAAALKGFYLSSVMDNFEWRKRTTERYGIEIGGGECVTVDIERLRPLGFTLDDLANAEWSGDWIKEFRDDGVIIDQPVEAKTNKFVSAYVRHKKGKGTSDDLAVVLAGKLYGKDAAIGVFLCDAIDTWDKYAAKLVPGGQDECAGGLIRQHEGMISKTYPGFKLPSDEEVMRFIYTIALQKDPAAISNSQRYLLQFTRKLNQSAIESHLKYVEGKAFREMRFYHISQNLTNTKMYRLFERRFRKNYRR